MKRPQPKNNKKGTRVVVVNYGKGLIVKYHVVKQYLILKNGKTKTILHYIDKTKTKSINKKVA